MRQPKITNLDCSIAGDHKVGRLEVPVEDPDCVEMFHAPAGVFHGAKSLSDCHGCALVLVLNAPVRQKLHPDDRSTEHLPIYFCDPHSPWQRGSNENLNGLLREYFPKSTDLSFHGPGILENVAAELNRRPRKRHGYRTPAEVLATLFSNPTNQTGVADTT